jgi:hypothetical protein
MHTVDGETREEILEQIKAVPLLTHRAEIPDGRLFRVETERPVIATGTFIVGRGTVDFQWNPAAEDASRADAAIPSRCRICGGEARDCFFAFCGHTIYCRACWEGLVEKPERCELCSMPIERLATPIDCSHDEEKTCGICMTEKVDAIIVPCGHLICSRCGQSWFEQHYECPYCRETFAKCRPFVSYA